jgi:hypothetical protein
MAPRHIVNEKIEEGDETVSHMRFDEIDSKGEQQIVDASIARRAGRVKLPKDCVVVQYREKSITRRFSAKQIVKSGGDLVRVFSEEDHGEDYEAIADQFIETMKLKDEHSNERPKFLSKEVYKGGKLVKDKPKKDE